MGTEGRTTWRHCGAAGEGAESGGPGGTARFPARALSLLVVVVTGLDTKSCPTLVTPKDWGPPVSSAHGISQARILEWITISFCRGSS